MRAIYFFEFPEMTETDMHVESWQGLMVEQVFEYKQLERFALVTGTPIVGTECMPINFGTEAEPDMREVVRVLFELPDIPGDEILMLFSGTCSKEFGEIPLDEMTPESRQHFAAVERIFYSTAMGVEGTLSQEVWMTDVLTVPGIEESRQRVICSAIENIPAFEARQSFVPSVENVAQALRKGWALPPNISVELVAEAQAMIDAAPQEALH